MNGCDMKLAAKLGMNYRNITKSDDPFWLLYKFLPIQLVNDTHTAISAPCTHNGLNSGIVEHLLQVGQSISIFSSKNKIPLAHGPAYAQIKTPALHNLYCRLDFLRRHKSSRTGNANGISRFQIGWSAPGYIIQIL